MTYTKSLRPYRKQLLPKFVQRRYPEFESLVDAFLKYYEEESCLSYWTTTPEKKANSCYANISEFTKNYRIEVLSIGNPELLEAYIKDFCNGLDLRNSALDIDLEVLRTLCNDSNIIFRLKGCHAAFNLFVHHLFDTFISGVPYSQTLMCRFINSSEFNGTITQLPEYSTIPDNETVITEIPGYRLVDNITALDELTITREIEASDGVSPSRLNIDSTDKGRHPHHYQIVAKSEVFKAGGFVRGMLKAFNPAGFHCEVFVEHQAAECPNYIDCKDFTQYNYLINCSNLP